MDREFRTRLSAIVFVCACVVGVVAGPSAASAAGPVVAESSSPAPLPPGFIEAPIPNQGFTIAYPKAWSLLDYSGSSAAVRGRLRPYREVFTSLSKKQAAANAKRDEKVFLLYALDMVDAKRNNFVDGVNITVHRASDVPVDVADFESWIAEGAPEGAAVAGQQLEMFGRVAYRGTMSNTLDLGKGKSVDAVDTTLVFLRENLMIRVDVSIGGDLPAGLAVTDQILSTIRMMP